MSSDNSQAPATSAPASAPSTGKEKAPYRPVDADANTNAEAPKAKAKAKAKAKPQPEPQPEAAPAADSNSGDTIVDRHLAAILAEPKDRTLVSVALRQLSKTEVSQLLYGLETKEAEAAFKAADPTHKAYRHALHAVASQLARELDARYGLRKEFGQKDGHGVYVEAGPLGTLGAGFGHVLKRQLQGGGTKSRHTGGGFYLRTGAVSKQEIGSSNRLQALLDEAKASLS